jgi:D-beta-D-heptose 7-phosphate kinase/D-beta-D-heptose 1-phosphate adenosyltransferase
MSPDLAQKLAAIGQPRILVVGDLILDRYIWGAVERVSPEAPIPILKVTAQDERPGGAGCVAANLAHLGARVACGRALGADGDGDALRSLMVDRGIDVEAVVRMHDWPSTVKTRFLARAQQLIRVDREEPDALPAETAKKVLAALRPKLARADIVLVADYNKGLLTPTLLRALIQGCREAGKPIVVDPARGVEATRYRGATGICPNRFEAAELAGLPERRANLDRVGRRLLRRLDLEFCIITRDRDGMSLHRPSHGPTHIRARAREVVDVTGAGDMVLSLLGLALASGGTVEDAARIANVAAGLEVTRLGVVPLSRDQIIAELEETGECPRTKAKGREELAVIVRKLRNQQRTTVFTNGCFDLLNANHIALLRYAKGLGDCLIVATNTDDSVRRLKGPSLPILTLAERVELLSAVRYVDYVTAFDEDTPRSLLQLLQPDILLKGGDYRAKKEVVGWDIVESYGGRIVRAPRFHYQSTSGIVETVLRSRAAKRA